MKTSERTPRTRPIRQRDPIALPEEIGWMGITLRAPESWSPVALQGDRLAGRLAVISPDTRCLEIRWGPSRGSAGPADALNHYLATLHKFARRRGAALKFRERVPGLEEARPREEAPLHYGWEADRKAVGCLWRCASCCAHLGAELVGGPGDDLSPAPGLIRSIRHQCTDPWNTWALYGLSVRVSAEYRLERHALVSGHQQLVLRSADSSLQVDRWGMAATILSSVELEAWFKSQQPSLNQHYSCSMGAAELHGHPAICFTGRDRPGHTLRKVLLEPRALVRRQVRFTGYLWHCPESNRILAVRGEHGQDASVVREAAAGVVCHPVRRGT